ncbi:MAG: hybrid sensor histidine kinase/response regulator [Anaerolineae bacterium]
MPTILHVEDNPANRILVKQVLEVAGYTVVEAHDGLAAIKMAQELQPDLILMDINIPGIDGYETTTRLKSLPGLNHVPIIALTAKTLAGDRERALTAGCDGYIAKPINVDTLAAQLAEFLAGRRETVSPEQQTVYLREYNERLVNRLQQKVEELTAINQSLAHTDVMKSRFINMAAHELRTPLTTIRGYLGILTAPGGPYLDNVDDSARELLEGVVTGVDRLYGIVQDMLDVTRIEAGTLQLKQSPVMLPQLFAKIEREFADAVARRQQSLRVPATKHIPSFWADGERLTQILRNLVSNAIKYTPDGGVISLNAALIEREGAAGQRLIEITVTDTGVGIAPEQRERIFENFHEVREIKHHSTSKVDFMGSGAGLGLPIARGVAEAHGGSLWVESQGHNPESCPGSTFHLLIPFNLLPQE